MVVLHAFLALLAGFAVMALLVMLVTAALARLTPDWVDPAQSNSPSTSYVFVNLGYSFIAAAAGGYVTAWVAGNNPLYHVLALAIKACDRSTPCLERVASGYRRNRPTIARSAFEAARGTRTCPSP